MLAALLGLLALVVADPSEALAEEDSPTEFIDSQFIDSEFIDSEFIDSEFIDGGTGACAPENGVYVALPVWDDPSNRIGYDDLLKLQELLSSLPVARQAEEACLAENGGPDTILMPRSEEEFMNEEVLAATTPERCTLLYNVLETIATEDLTGKEVWTYLETQRHSFLALLNHCREQQQADNIRSLLVEALAYDVLNETDTATALYDALVALPNPGPTFEHALNMRQSFARETFLDLVVNGRSQYTPRHDYDPAGLEGWKRSWAGEPLEPDEPATAPRECDIDRRADLSPEEFISEYVEKGKPVMLSGLLEDWPARTTWSRKPLLERFGKNPAPSFTSVLLAKYLRGTGTMMNPNVTDLDSFVREMDRTPDDERDPPYFFSRAAFNSPSLPEGTSLIGLIDNAAFEFDEMYREDRAFFFIGGELSGSFWHRHTTAYNALLFGSKTWYLLPPASTWRHVLTNGDDEVITVPDWLERNAARNRSIPLQCTQHAGEVMFVPSLWPHATINHGVAVGAAFELGHYLPEPEQYYNFLRTPDTGGDLNYRKGERRLLKDGDIRIFERLDTIDTENGRIEWPDTK